MANKTDTHDKNVNTKNINKDINNQDSLETINLFSEDIQGGCCSRCKIMHDDNNCPGECS